MPQYAALIYGEDADWSAPEYAGQTAEYGEFGAAAGHVIRGGAALQPTSTATTISVKDGLSGPAPTGSRAPRTETLAFGMEEDVSEIHPRMS